MSDSLRQQLQASLGTTYTVERELGGGGMSRVFLAEETRFGRRVVIKVLAPELAAGLSVERFEREIALAAALQDPHIVPVLAAGELDGLPWYTMPFVEGESLRARSANGNVSVSDAIDILRDVAKALAYAHAHGVIHRDIKPENVLLASDTAVVTDFGIAKAVSAATTQASGRTLTQSGASIGTPAYMAPEQAAGDVVDHRADIYAWGVMAYELLAGVHPFADRTTSQQLLAAHIAEEPASLSALRPTLPPTLTALVRRTLEKDPAARPSSARDLIVTLNGLATGDELSAAGGSRRTTSRRTAISAAVIALIALGGWWIAHAFGKTATPVSAVAAPSPAVISTIAVLPFANTSGDPKDEYFSDGMTDELAQALSRLPGLRLAGRTSSFAFKGKAVTAQEIGKVLDVAGIVEGTVRRSGDRLRVTAVLTSTVDGKQRWSDRYESTAKDVFAVQDELTTAIVAALAPALRGAQPTHMAEESRGTANLEAYDLYLQGKHLWQLRGAENLLRAIQYFERAARVDSTFARAYAGLGLANVILGGYVPDATGTFVARGIAASEHALALDSTVVDAKIALADAHRSRNEGLQAEPLFQSAIAQAPDNATAHHWHGNNLLLLGRLDDAVASYRRALAIDPLSAVVYSNLTTALYSARRFGEALVASRRRQELNPTFVDAGVGTAYVLGGFPDSAVAILEQMRLAAPNAPELSSSLAFAYAAEARWDDVDRIRMELNRPGGDNWGGIQRAIVAMIDGDPRPLAGLLSTRIGQQQWLSVRFSIGCDPLLDLLMADTAFTAMVDRMGVHRCPVTTPWPIKPRPVKRVAR